jgi:uncharacterized protein YjiS (DUF1127 family)
MIAYHSFPNWQNLKQALSEWRRRIRSRTELADLDDRMLRDIGLSRYDARLGSSRLFRTP